jgi:hypothetical protein
MSQTDREGVPKIFIESVITTFTIGKFFIRTIIIPYCGITILIDYPWQISPFTLIIAQICSERRRDSIQFNLSTLDCGAGSDKST